MVTCPREGRSRSCDGRGSTPTLDRPLLLLASGRSAGREALDDLARGYDLRHGSPLAGARLDQASVPVVSLSASLTVACCANAGEYAVLGTSESVTLSDPSGALSSIGSIVTSANVLPAGMVTVPLSMA